ncbi:hypothetical protein D3C73_1663450 [compost metagenome]
MINPFARLQIRLQPECQLLFELDAQLHAVITAQHVHIGNPDEAQHGTRVTRQIAVKGAQIG